MITTISPNYRVYESKEEEKLILTQTDKSLPFYDEPLKLEKGDYIILLFSFSDRFIFAAMNESSFANKYLVGRA